MSYYHACFLFKLTPAVVLPAFRYESRSKRCQQKSDQNRDRAIDYLTVVDPIRKSDIFEL
jgi:hypothetical protein